MVATERGRQGLTTEVRRIGNSSGNPREIRPPEALRDILEGKILSPEEERAAQAADFMSISLLEKKIIFGTVLFRGSRGVFRARELLGTTHLQTVSMRDRVVTDKKYIQLWNIFGILQRPNFLEVATLKAQRKQHAEIAGILGRSKLEVDEISKYLISAGVMQPSPRGRGQADKFRRVVQRVEAHDDSDSSEPRPTQSDLSENLGFSQSQIKRARRVRRIKDEDSAVTPAKAKKPNSKEVAARRRKVKEGLDKGLTNRQISREYTIPFVNVRDDRAYLRRKKQIPKVTYRKSQNKEKLRALLDLHMVSTPPGTPFNLKEVERSGGIEAGYTSLWNYYREIKLEQEVPSLR